MCLKKKSKKQTILEIFERNKKKLFRNAQSNFGKRKFSPQKNPQASCALAARQKWAETIFMRNFCAVLTFLTLAFQLAVSTQGTNFQADYPLYIDSASVGLYTNNNPATPCTEYGTLVTGSTDGDYIKWTPNKWHDGRLVVDAGKNCSGPIAAVHGAPAQLTTMLVCALNFVEVVGTVTVPLVSNSTKAATLHRRSAWRGLTISTLTLATFP